MSTLVLDCGALIALERNDRAMWIALAAASRDDDVVIVPSTALAQAWRGTQKQAMLARALDHCAIATFDPLARRVGELCGRARTADVCDAHVALVASMHGDVLYTSDPKDMKVLIAAAGRRRPTIAIC